MKKEVKQLWLKALLSGEFKQCKGYLEKDGRYCALGVLSLLAMLDGQCTYKKEERVGMYDNRKFTLSFNTRVWAGVKNFLEPEAGVLKIRYQGKDTSIQELNDKGMSFRKLARIIDECL